MTTLAPQALLFDLDGTLIDSAPDLAGAGNEMRVARGLPELPLAHFRPMVGAGARGMVGRALGVRPGEPDFEALRDEFLQRYEARMTRETRVFAAMQPVLAACAARRLPWGIVTNKATRFSEPLVKALGLADVASALVCGDTTPHAKPHPAPASTSATTCATCRRRTRPGWSRWPRPGATSARATTSRPGAPGMSSPARTRS